MCGDGTNGDVGVVRAVGEVEEATVRTAKLEEKKKAHKEAAKKPWTQSQLRRRDRSKEWLKRQNKLQGTKAN